MTEYLVFQAEDEQANTLTFLGRSDARDAGQAIRSVVVDKGIEGAAHYVAIPARSFTVLSIETKRAVVVVS